MSDTRSEVTPPTSFPSSTHLDVSYGPLEGVDRTRAPERTVILIVEGAGIITTGDWR
jgi:hypothetical protein